MIPIYGSSVFLVKLYFPPGCPQLPWYFRSSPWYSSWRDYHRLLFLPCLLLSTPLFLSHIKRRTHDDRFPLTLWESGFVYYKWTKWELKIYDGDLDSDDVRHLPWSMNYRRNRISFDFFTLIPWLILREDEVPKSTREGTRRPRWDDISFFVSSHLGLLVPSLVLLPPQSPHCAWTVQSGCLF